MVDNLIPIGFGGGLTRFNEEYKSKIQFSPGVIIIFVILVIALVISLKYFFPIN